MYTRLLKRKIVRFRPFSQLMSLLSPEIRMQACFM